MNAPQNAASRVQRPTMSPSPLSTSHGTAMLTTSTDAWLLPVAASSPTDPRSD